MSSEDFLENNKKEDKSLKRNEDVAPAHSNSSPSVYTDTEIGPKPWEWFQLNGPF